MPIHEYRCFRCGDEQEVIFTSIEQAEKSVNPPCEKCGAFTECMVSAANFKVAGFNAKNGYNLPNYSDVIDEDGHAKKEWGRD